jgi:hypothetical protein
VARRRECNGLAPSPSISKHRPQSHARRPPACQTLHCRPSETPPPTWVVVRRRRQRVLEGPKQPLLVRLAAGVWVGEVPADQQHVAARQRNPPLAAAAAAAVPAAGGPAAAAAAGRGGGGRGRGGRGRRGGADAGRDLDAARDRRGQRRRRERAGDGVGGVAAVAGVGDEIDPQFLGVNSNSNRTVFEVSSNFGAATCCDQFTHPGPGAAGGPSAKLAASLPGDALCPFTSRCAWCS